MSRWSEQYEKHRIHETVQTIWDWLDVEVGELSAEHEDERRRLKKALDLIKGALEGQDPELFPENLITNLDNLLRQAQVWNQLQSYASNQNVQHLRTANDHLNSLLHVVYQIAALSGPPESVKKVRAVEKAYGEFCSVVEKATLDIETRLQESERRLDEVSGGLGDHEKSLAALKAQTGEALNEWQHEFGEAQNARAEDFSSAQIQRGEKFDETVREARNNSEAKILEISTGHDAELKAYFEQFIQVAERFLDDMKDKHSAILEIHGLVGTDGVAGGYQKTAKDEQKAANTWRLVAMVSLGLAAVWLALKFYLGFGSVAAGGLNWAELVTAGSLTLVLLAAAGYASRQSKTHRDLEQQMRWFSLEVKAIDPFLSSLDDADQKELKKKLSERLFGKDRTANEPSKSRVDVKAYKELSETILSPVQEILKLSGKG